MVPAPIRALTGVTPNGLPGARWLVRAGLAQAFGPPPFDPRADRGDPGLHGPGSASWRVIGEPASIVGGIRALLVQVLHPLAMAGVADHSDFRGDPLGRLNRTSTYVTTTTFGSMPQVIEVARIVRRVHRTVVGSAPDGRRYRADDVHLLAWVSVALTSSFLASDRAYAPHPVDPATADAFVVEQSRGAALLDPRVDLDALTADAGALAALRAGELALPLLADGTLPRDVDELERRLEAYRPELAVTEQAREALAFLRWPSIPPLLRAAYVPLLAAAVATVSPPERRMLGLPAMGPITWPLWVSSQGLLALLRLAAGRSPALEAATRRAAAVSGDLARPTNRRTTPTGEGPDLSPPEENSVEGISAL